MSNRKLSAGNKSIAKGFRWPGGKNALGKIILSYSPIRSGGKFIDVCAGRGALTFWAWELDFKFEAWVINDPHTAPFFQALREIKDKVRVPPCTREEFERQRRLAQQGDQRAILLEGWLCFNGATYDSSGWSSSGGRRSPESYEQSLRAAKNAIIQKNPNITANDWLVCIEREHPGPNDLVVFDGPYMGCNVGPYKPDNILPVEFVAWARNATCRWLLCEYRQPLYIAAFGEPAYQREVQLKTTNFAVTGGHEKRIECVWTSESYKTHLAKVGANRDLSRLEKPVLADRPDRYYANLTLEELVGEIEEGMFVITTSRLQMNAEMRRRLLPALLALRKRTYRKHPGYYETLASIGLNADTVRQWFYRSYTADAVLRSRSRRVPDA
jgi:hypothetical protein